MTIIVFSVFGRLVFFVILVVNCVPYANWYRARLTAIDNSPHAEQLYIQLRNQAPSFSNFYEDADTRRNICETITSTDYFSERNQDPVNMDSVRRTLKKEYKNVYKLIYKKRQSILRRGSKYKNSYVVRQFKVNEFLEEEYRQNLAVREYVIVCLTSGSHARDIIPYYVSKEYNVSGSPDYYIGGRFIFSYFTGKFEALAEEPSQAHIHPRFNVELYYLGLRKRHRPVPIQEAILDPLCRLTVRLKSPHNQWNRLCVSALGSLYFRTKIKYPHRAENQDPCQYTEITFRTEDAIRQIQTTGIKYYEWMIMCEAQDIISETTVYFCISRAYASNHVFVYSVDYSFEIIHLENLSSKISVIDIADAKFKKHHKFCSSSHF